MIFFFDGRDMLFGCAGAFRGDKPWKADITIACLWVTTRLLARRVQRLKNERKSDDRTDHPASILEAAVG